jgi:ABC-type transport system substrate-binding protein
MKRAAILLTILAVIACGCTTTENAPDGPSATPAVPDLTGTWTGTMNGYDQGTGFNDHPNGTIALVVTGQRGRIFSGLLTVTEDNATLFSGEVAGAIGREGRTFLLVEESGYGSGVILGTDEIEFTYLNDAAPFSVSIDSLKRE